MACQPIIVVGKSTRLDEKWRGKYISPPKNLVLPSAEIFLDRLVYKAYTRRMKKNSTVDRQKRTTLRLSHERHKQFKILAAKKEMSMTDLLTEWIREKIGNTGS